MQISNWKKGLKEVAKYPQGRPSLARHPTVSLSAFVCCFRVCVCVCERLSGSHGRGLWNVLFSLTSWNLPYWAVIAYRLSGSWGGGRCRGETNKLLLSTWAFGWVRWLVSATLPHVDNPSHMRFIPPKLLFGQWRCVSCICKAQLYLDNAAVFWKPAMRRNDVSSFYFFIAGSNL